MASITLSVRMPVLEAVGAPRATGFRRVLRDALLLVRERYTAELEACAERAEQPDAGRRARHLDEADEAAELLLAALAAPPDARRLALRHDEDED